MAVLEFIVKDILGQASILVGLVAMVGLILQKKSFEKVLSGTLKTILGFVIFNLGSSAAAGALGNFQLWFAEGFNLQGVLPLAEAVTGMAQTQYPVNIALVMVFGLVMNLVVARLTKFKNIFLTGQHSLFLSAMLVIIFKWMGLSDVLTVVLGSVIVGLAASIYPEVSQKYTRQIIGNDSIAMGHYCNLAYGFSGYIGSKVGNPEESTENIKLPGWLSIFKDYLVSIAVSIGIFFYVAAIAAGSGVVSSTAGGVHWLVFPFMQTLQFTAGVYVIITGVRLLLGELVPAFVGISERWIPNSRPALDCPVVFPYAPTATVIGFMSAYVAGLIMMFVFAALDLPVIIPVAIPYFFIGGTAGVYGNVTGGWKGAVVGSFIVGILIAVGPQLMYPVMEEMGLAGTGFPETDFNLIGYILYWIAKLLGLGA